MTTPLVINLPHKLGRDEARRRIEGGTSKLASHIPGGAAEVSHDWAGDRMNLSVQAMGQAVTSQIDVEEANVRLQVLLPGMLGMFSSQIEAFLRGKGGQLLEDKSRKD
ncbi:polyhydroxyalkanoic acid system family protein [Allosphingosinicella flava]|uniref:Polyhydroxyalkanoic acid system family protein n=1 Tax=Allosphingosinicella flava TaxID=2771430 RepID=A0A7T2GJZ7_9SPHN|nr:polyhydroxyalkanoic acid system family protein [Sphingosinicella flava]QPQ54888.1 polyhydroxyalkanoic acid system family protein [Sphingosinicella flava]